MLRQLWSSRRRVLPVPLRLVLIGWLGGLISGAIYLPISVDLAPARGFVMFVSLTLGLWIGANIGDYLLAVSLNRLRSLLRRVEDIFERLGIESNDVTRPKTGKASMLFIKLTSRVFVYSMVLLLPVCVTEVIYIFLVSQTSELTTELMPWMAGAFAVLIVVGMAVEWGQLWWWGRQLGRVERQLQDVNLEHWAVKSIDVNYLRAPKLFTWVIGREALTA